MQLLLKCHFTGGSSISRADCLYDSQYEFTTSAIDTSCFALVSQHHLRICRESGERSVADQTVLKPLILHYGLCQFHTVTPWIPDFVPLRLRDVNEQNSSVRGRVRG